jgi:hypothetical protein
VNLLLQKTNRQRDNKADAIVTVERMITMVSDAVFPAATPFFPPSTFCLLGFLYHTCRRPDFRYSGSEILGLLCLVLWFLILTILSVLDRVGILDWPVGLVLLHHLSVLLVLFLLLLLVAGLRDSLVGAVAEHVVGLSKSNED